MGTSDHPYALVDDPYIDPSSGLLRNKLRIANAQKLQAAEDAAFTSGLLIILETQPYTFKDFSFQLLLTIHQQLFGNIYDWAGQIRTVEVSKGTTRFAYTQHIEQAGQAIFRQLRTENYLQNLPHPVFVERLAHYYAELNVLHPFREGNGRSVRALLSLLALLDGYHIAWDMMDAQANIDASAWAYSHDNSKLIAMLMPIVLSIY